MVIIAWSMHDFCVGVFEVHPQADQGRRSWWICRDKRSQRRPQCWPRFSRGRQDRPRSTTWRHWWPWPRQANNQQRRGSRPEFTVEIFRKFSHLLQHSLNTSTNKLAILSKSSPNFIWKCKGTDRNLKNLPRGGRMFSIPCYSALFFCYFSLCAWKNAQWTSVIVPFLCARGKMSVAP